MVRSFGEAGKQVGPYLEAQGHDQIVIGDGGALEDDLLPSGIDPQDLRLEDPDVSLLQTLELSRDVLGPALPHHEEQKRGHEDVVGPAVDERYVMVGAEGAAELGGGHHSPTASPEYDDLLASVVVVHL